MCTRRMARTLPNMPNLACGGVVACRDRQYKTELIAAFQAGIDALHMARGG